MPQGHFARAVMGPPIDERRFSKCSSFAGDWRRPRPSMKDLPFRAAAPMPDDAARRHSLIYLYSQRLHMPDDDASSSLVITEQPADTPPAHLAAYADDAADFRCRLLHDHAAMPISSCCSHARISAAGEVFPAPHAMPPHTRRRAPPNAGEAKRCRRLQAAAVYVATLRADARPSFDELLSAA